jgi:hypothetical protein
MRSLMSIHSWRTNSLNFLLGFILCALVVIPLTGCENALSIQKKAADVLMRTTDETLARLDENFEKIDKEILNNTARIMQLEKAAEPAFKWIEEQRTIAANDGGKPRNILWGADLGPLKNVLYELKSVRFIIDAKSPLGRYSIVIADRATGEQGEFDDLRAGFRAKIKEITPGWEAQKQRRQKLASTIRTVAESYDRWVSAKDNSGVWSVSGPNLGLASDGSLTTGQWQYNPASNTMTPIDDAAKALEKLLIGQ